MEPEAEPTAAPADTPGPGAGAACERRRGAPGSEAGGVAGGLGAAADVGPAGEAAAPGAVSGAGAGCEPVPVGRAVDFGEARLLPDVDRPRAWLLTVDGAPQSYVDLDDPEHLEFEYARRLAYAAEAAFGGRGGSFRAGPHGAASGATGEAGAAPAVDVVHLGGGAMAVPRRLARTLGAVRQHVVEADRALAELVTEHLPLEPATAASLSVHTQDARGWLAARPADSADLVVADVFGGSRVPAHVTSVEFAREAARVLRPGGLYLANIADAAPLAFLGGQLATLREAFGGPEQAALCVLAEPGVLRGRRFGNAVVAAARGELPLRLDVLARRCAADPFPARLVHGAALADLYGAPVYDASATPSPEPPEGAFTVG
jgi:SAM-dependent methyltransferase